VSTLGTGAFGDVFRVRCLQSTSLGESGTTRVLMDSNTAKKAKS